MVIDVIREIFSSLLRLLGNDNEFSGEIFCTVIRKFFNGASTIPSQSLKAKLTKVKPIKCFFSTTEDCIDEINESALFDFFYCIENK